jgi:hypothetical protein
MAMGTAIVSTSLGVEGIEAVPGRDLLVEDQPEAFADAVNRLLAEPGLAARLRQAARRLAVQRYSWSGAAEALESFYRTILDETSRQFEPGRLGASVATAVTPERPEVRQRKAGSSWSQIFE